MAEAETLRHRMVETRAERGELDERWRVALTEVPRHLFIPDVVWRQDRDAAGDCDLVPLRRADDPGAWLELAYANGYNAALLAHRLGAERVVSVEVDPAVAEHARSASPDTR